MRGLSFFLVALLLSASTQAQTGGSPSAFEAGKSLAEGKTESMFSGISSGSAQGKIPKYGSNTPEMNYFADGKGDTSGPGVAKINACASYTPGPDKIANQECEAVNFLARNPQVRPQFNISKNDPMIQRAKQLDKNAEQAFAQFFPGGTGGSSQCVTKTETIPGQYSTETCVSSQEIGTQQCTMGRVINIDTDANFQCDQTLSAYETLKCRRGNNVVCTGGGDGCDQGGIIPNSWAGDMATSFTPDGAGNYILQFGTIADNYWCGWGVVHDRNLTFNIRDVGLITRFALTRAAFDDWLMVKVNGNLVYVGPYGGDRLEFVQHWINIQEWMLFEYVQYCANCFGSPELGTSWNISLNIDIRPYLRNGSNTIFVRTIVAGCGEGAIQLTTRQACPRVCSVSTRNDCAALEARSR